MPKSAFAIVMVLLLSFGALHARGAATVLPPDVIAADTVMVIHADAAHLNPDKFQAAATMLLGDDAKELDEPMRKFREMFNKATTAGVDAATMVVGAAKKDDPEERNGTGILYLTLKPDADVKAIEAMLMEKVMERGDKHEVVFDQVDNFLAMHPKKLQFPVKPDADREAAFADALKTISGSSLQIAFIPDAATREAMKKAADDAGDLPKDIRPLLAKSKWMALAIDLGSAPRITASANAASEADAKSMSEGIKLELDDFKTQITKPGPLALAAPMIEKVIDGLKTTQADSHISLSINADSLKLLVAFADTMGMFGGDR